MVGSALYLDENGDMPSEKALRKRHLTIRQLRLLGIEPINERKRREFVEVLPRDLKLATR